ncbi:MAG: glycosyltransferase [Actinomycetota bacterium]|nr:glycosyltransferase [Actinomycetota bacterium]
MTVLAVPAVDGSGQSLAPPPRPAVRGKFIFAGDEKLYVRGATYGAFRPDEHGVEFHDAATIDRDFAQMALNGFNAVRIPHTMPPTALLDTAQRHGLKVMVGLSAEQYVGYLSDRKDGPDVEEIVRAKVAGCAGHPALLCYALGNEIPAPTARWLGRRKVERYLERLFRVVKEEDPDALVTYVNYPSTEYLDLPFLDLLCFNVYLENEDRLEAYLHRLQNLAGDTRPLLMSEIGLDSLRNGEHDQARSLEWQLRTSFAAGCAGAFVFSWTDEWFRGGEEVEDWAFGLTRKDRQPKPALAAVREAFADVPFPQGGHLPRVSVVACCYNEEDTIGDCLDGLSEVVYPDFEVIVVDDGSTDATAAIASQYDVRLISTENRGLSSARNTGLEAATGEVVAYLDGDARPDPHWLQYLAATFLTSDYAGVGGPNIPPPGDGAVADCVANAPGGPVHVLLSDREAEHIPGCNMAFLRSVLEKIDGFDPRFRAAGDDVDVCWRLQEKGFRVGFSPAAVVWHHRRSSVRGYWAQQHGYGKAEALLEEKWPEKYNKAGHANWAGRIYGNGTSRPIGRVQRIYHGTWGTAPFQGRHEPEPVLLASLPLMPEWLLVVAGLIGLSAGGLLWTPLLGAVPLAVVATGALLVQAGMGGARAKFPSPARSTRSRLPWRVLTAFLHVVQPMARLKGRLAHGLTPWRRRGRRTFVVPRRRTATLWVEQGREPEARLQALTAILRRQRVAVTNGGPFDDWDLEVRTGGMGGARFLMAVEEHGGGSQYLRFGLRPLLPIAPGLFVLVMGALGAWAAFDGAWLPAGVLGGVALLSTVAIVRSCAAAMATLQHAVSAADEEP